MRKSMFMLLLVAQQAMAQVNVYECDPAYAPTTAQEVNNAAYHLHKPCILMENEPYEIITSYPKYVTASEYIHIKAEDQNQDYFHAGPYSGTDHFWMRIENKDIPYEIWALNYNDLTAIPRYKKLELGIKLEGELLDRINAFLHQTSIHPEPLNPFLEWELDINVKFVHAQTLTEKWRDGFYTEEYTVNETINDWETATNDFPLRVRFAPPLNGLWNTYVSITYDNNTIELPMFSFNVVESGHPGYVKVHNNKKNLQRGASIVMPIGHVFPGPYNRVTPLNGIDSKMPWGDPPSSNKNANPEDWEAYIGDIASYIAQGGKSFKMVQTSYGNLIEFEELGNYYNRLHYAWEQDKILDLCEENDVLVNFNLLFQDVIMAYGQNGGGQVDLGWCQGYDQDAWDYGNYGGNGQVNPCDYFPTYCYFEPGTLPSSMFLDPERFKYHKERTRYYVARYGYSPQIYTWELMSEPMAMDQFLEATIIALNGVSIPNTPAQFFYHPGFLTAITAINQYHNSLSDYIRNQLKDGDHLIAMDVAPLQEGLEDPIMSNLTCMANSNIDILGFNLYSARPDKWIESKDKNDNGKRNTEFGSPGKKGAETSLYKSINAIHEQYAKPVILAELGHLWDRNCMGETGNIIDATTGGFCGIAAMHPWSGYSYGGSEELFDDRLLWSSTISSEQHMNSEKVIPTLDHWNGDWVQGRQAQVVFSSNDEFPKELQYYISESKELVVGYVRNRSYNVWTQRLSGNCVSLLNAVGFTSPLDNFYPFEWDYGNRRLYVYPLEENTYYTIRWYEFLTGSQIAQESIETKGDGRFRLEYPALTSSTRPIIWFSMEKSSGQRILPEETDEIPKRTVQNLFIYPNPFEDNFTVYSDHEDVVDILSITGVKVGEYRLRAGDTRIELETLSAGIYFVHSKLTGEVTKIVKK